MIAEAPLGAMYVAILVLAGMVVIGVLWEHTIGRRDDDAERYDSTLSEQRYLAELRRLRERNERGQ